MDANIKAAASLLRNAAYTMQQRIRELQADETNVAHRESQEEKKIKSDMLRTEIILSEENGNASSSSHRIRRLLDLRKRLSQVKDDAHRKVTEEEKEIRVLQGKINKLNELARTLEMWH